MNVLSLFDGAACGYEALKRIGIKVDKYYASEINTHAIKIAMKNHPDIIQIGDVRNIKSENLPKIDLVIGGFPCQAFSIGGKQKGFKDPRGTLFFEYIKILKQINPKYFLAENVKMKKELQEGIDEHFKYFNVKPIEINSNLLSAQNRRRLYWTNIPNITLPEDKGILLKDIVHEYNNEDFNLSEYIVPFDKTLKILDKEVERGKVGYFRKDSQANRVYYIHNKAITLCGEAGGGAGKMGQYLFGCITPDRINKRQNGQRFNTGEKFYTLTAQDKHGVLVEGYIRKLSPIECERLQTLPDNYTLVLDENGKQVVSNTQRYKALGNGWTVDVIAHILKNIKQ